MNIVHIIPGSGGSFYCGNCLRDGKFYSSIQKLGHDIIKIPMYLPLFSHDLTNDDVPVFYGAVSIYLKQQFPFFRHAPRWFDKILNTRPVLNLAAKKAGSTRAKGLEEMTISMLMGENGNQSQELDKMITWLETQYKPDVIHLSNALLLGLVPGLKKRLGVPVVCSLQDEDVWVDVMSEQNRQRVWDLMSEKSSDVDAFISVSNYFKAEILKRMQIPADKIHVLHIGVDPADYNYINAPERERAVGFLSRMCEANGLDILIDAFIILKENPVNKDVRLFVSGGYTGDDAGFIKEQKKKIKDSELSSDVIFLDNFESRNRHIFFDRISVLSVPVRKGEAFGIYLAEAMASGIPVVQPALGAFPEIINKSGGGVIYEENKPHVLAGSLHQLLNDSQKMDELSKQGRKSIEYEFNINNLSASLADIYDQTCNHEE